MSMLREILAGQTDKLQLLVAIDSFVSFAGGETLPRLHFNEDQQPAAPHDQIDLAAAHPLIAADDRESAQPVEPGCATLAACAELRDRNDAPEVHRR